MMSNQAFFEHYRKQLEDLETRLGVPVDKWRRFGRRLLWPMKERDFTEVVHRLKVEQKAHLLGSQQLDVMLDWLNAPDPSPRHNRLLAERMETTGSWLLEHQIFKKWHDSASAIWLRGIPGCGKSVLSSVVIDHVQHRIRIEQRDTAAMAYYHFDFSDKSVSKPDTMLRSLVSQLSCWNGTLPTALERCARLGDWNGASRATTYYKAPQPSVPHLLAVLHEIATMEYERVYIVVDALDECELHDELGLVLDTMLSWKADGVHMFLTGRSTPILARHLGAQEVVHTIEVEAGHPYETTSRKQQSLRNSKPETLETGDGNKQYARSPYDLEDGEQICMDDDLIDQKMDDMPRKVRLVGTSKEFIFKGAFWSKTSLREIQMLSQIERAREEATMLTSRLAGILKEKRGEREIQQSTKSKWAEQIKSSLQQLHAYGVVWGDAKPDNVMIDSNNDAVIIDFGGGYTHGYVTLELMETVEGDWVGFEQLKADLGLA
ncbi:hypothetical protein EKO27_g2925 [Xylaria grammica]|uniref:Protein kinase domain-containing protein n=1 Tax=Xylaria grammica TaxID=363999 RepID=A0A439DCN5_9PEZI|nr:hypothetical protein EKO27_g2925 [Xylaria grammica]